MNIQPIAGDILHCERKSISSKVIGFFTKGKSHTVKCIDIYGILYVIEAQSKGIQLIRFDLWVNKYHYQYIISRPIFPFSQNQLTTKALSRSGHVKYDWIGTLFCQPIYIITGVWLKRAKETKDGRMYCSDFIAWLENIPEYWKKSPEDIFQYCLNYPQKYITF